MKVEPKIIPGKFGGWRPNSGRKPGFVGYWKGKKRPDVKWEHLEKYWRGENNIFSKIKFEGENHAKWKGDKVGYQALHSWVRRKKGKPLTCEFCGYKDTRPKMIQWANKSRKYLRDLNDWISLCAKCHWKYDRKI